MNVRVILSICFKVVVLAAIPSLSKVVSMLWVIQENLVKPMADKIMTSASVVSVILYLGVGLYLMLRPWGIVWLMTRGKVEPRMDTD